MLSTQQAQKDMILQDHIRVLDICKMTISDNIEDSRISIFDEARKKHVLLREKAFIVSSDPDEVIQKHATPIQQ